MELYKTEFIRTPAFLRHKPVAVLETANILSTGVIMLYAFYQKFVVNYVREITSSHDRE